MSAQLRRLQLFNIQFTRDVSSENISPSSSVWAVSLSTWLPKLHLNLPETPKQFTRLNMSRKARQIVSIPPWVGLVQNLSLVLAEFWRGSNLTLIDKFLSSHDVAMQCWTTTDMRLYYNATTEPPLRTCLVSARTPSLLVSVLQLLEGARCQHWYTSERERVGVAPQKVIWYYNILL